MEMRSRGDRRTLVVIVVGVLVVAATAVWWTTTRDDRRVDAACGTYVVHRDALRSALSETSEAFARAGAGSTDVREELDDRGVVRAGLEGWTSVSPSVTGSLAGTTADSGEGLEDNLTYFLGQLDEQVAFLDQSIEAGDPERVADEVQEMRARLQTVDDLCLAAARAD